MTQLPVAFLTGILLAQMASATTPEAVLRKALQDPRRAQLDRAVGLAADANSLNPFDKFEAKVSRGELLQSDLKYGLRFYPKSYSELKTGSKFRQAMMASSKAAQAEGTSLLLMSRYSFLTRAAHLKDKKKVADQLTVLMNAAGRALSFLAGKDRSELKAYVKAKADLDRLRIKVADVERDIANVEMELQELRLGSLAQFDFADWAGMDEIRQRLEQSKMPDRALSARIATEELNRAKSEIEYSRAQDGRWVDHIEVSMKEESKDDRQEQVYGVELSFNLPGLSAPDLRTIDKASRLIRDEVKTADQVEKFEREFRNSRNELRTLLDLHKTLTAADTRLSPEQMRLTSQKVAAQDPLLSIEMQRQWFENRDQVLELELRIRDLYVAYLYEASVLADAPEINHLSKSLKRIM